MDFFTLIWAGITVLIGCILGSGAATMLFQQVTMTQLYARINRVEGMVYSRQGVEAREANRGETRELMEKVGGVLKDDAIPKEEKLKAVMSAAAEHPEAAEKLLTRLMKWLK